MSEVQQSGAQQLFGVQQLFRFTYNGNEHWVISSSIGNRVTYGSMNLQPSDELLASGFSQYFKVK